MTNMPESDTGPTVRPYRARDREALLELWATAFPDDPPRNAPETILTNKLRVQPELLLIAEGPEGLLGAVMVGYDGFRGWIYHLAVREDQRRRGVGTALVRSAEDRLRALGCPKVNLQIRVANADVEGFYRSLGYAVEDRVSMGRVLDG
jgi:ribosomal protein S18 acetylase RimI-like enzyme